MDSPIKPISLRLKAEQREMLTKLAKQFSITEADVMRFALKQLYDRTFPALAAPVRFCKGKKCTNPLAPGDENYCGHCLRHNHQPHWKGLR